MWKEENISALVDEVVSDPCDQGEALRCIHVGLLCVQDLAVDRPPMSTVISMLNSEIAYLPSPKQPAFTEKRQIVAAEMSSQNDEKIFSINDVTITEVQGR